MPCPDQTALLKIKISDDDRILDCTFAKYSCGKPVGIGSELKRLIVGMPARQVLDLSLPDAAGRLGLHSEDDRFLLLVELEALTAGIALFLGVESGATPRYSLNGLRREDGYFEILLDAAPVPTAPAVPLPCSSYVEDRPTS
ncbi:MAG: hypothetical protein A3G34_04585 [Candidatus Lindowbacteria bacterium RIFCSPLOWO2_12_FULL_62_27]|nr:MAG: hypothetical protein A3I06_04345 [Candidatus Lindowbacteria bacterium RIFCSPLOWO2_02_FULL_62_12]OGH57436.1 MAG: hypothetical protein A3G34_04585 [Candidatus Lindowbacteria bacterium RIFCSPLOWO2_12_FULL_62_27]